MRFLPGNRQKLLQDAKAILHLPFWDRLVHSKARKPLIGTAIGSLIMLTGSAIASSMKHSEGYSALTHVSVDTFGYLLHGIGAIPILKYCEPAWMVLIGASTQEL